MPMLLLIVAAGVTIVGAAALWAGWRGRRVGDHPVCRRCEFDLFGKPDESRACPECGAELSKRRATVIGVRQHRPGVLTCGAMLLLAGLSGGGAMGWTLANHIVAEAYEPTWWLARQAMSRD